MEFILAVVLLLPGGLGAAESEHGATGKAGRFEELVSHYQNCGYLSGAVLVAEHGKVIFEKGVGKANRESHTPNTPQTKFGIASITKQFTAALVLKMAAAGKIRLDGTVSDYLPWFRRDTGKQMTIEQLLHHTSGLPADYDMPEFSDSPEATRHYEAEAFAEEFCQPALAAKPGTKWAYSNCGYVLLGVILERVSGKSFEDLLCEQILEPLGMKNTGLYHADFTQLGGATGYLRHAGPRYTPGPRLDQSHFFSAGAMYSTVEDLLIWNQALSADGLFSKEVREQMFKPGMSHWAGGWFVTRIPQGKPGAGNALAEMRGDMPSNFFAWILRYPEQEGVIIVLRNSYESTEHLEENLQAVFFGQAPHLPSRSAKDVAAHAWQRTCAAVVAHGGVELVAMVVVLVTGVFWRTRNLAAEGRRQGGEVRV